MTVFQRTLNDLVQIQNGIDQIIEKVNYANEGLKISGNRVQDMFGHIWRFVEESDKVKFWIDETSTGSEQQIQYLIERNKFVNEELKKTNEAYTAEFEKRVFAQFDAIKRGANDMTQEMQLASEAVSDFSEKMGVAQTLSQANRSDLAKIQSSLTETAEQAEQTTAKLSGVIEPFITLRGELKKLDADSSVTAEKLRSLGAVGLKSGAPSGGAVKSAAEMTATELENLARALKPVLDKIDRRQL